MRQPIGIYSSRQTFCIKGTSGKIQFDGNGDKQPIFWVEDLKNTSDDSRIFAIVETYLEKSEVSQYWDIYYPVWDGYYRQMSLKYIQA